MMLSLGNLWKNLWIIRVLCHLGRHRMELPQQRFLETNQFLQLH